MATTKLMTQRDSDQATRTSYNDVNATLGVDGFLIGLVGRQVAVATSTTTVSGDTQTFTFSENFGTNTLYALQLVYTDGSQTVLLTATRIS